MPLSGSTGCGHQRRRSQACDVAIGSECQTSIVSIQTKSRTQNLERMQRWGAVAVQVHSRPPPRPPPHPAPPQPSKQHRAHRHVSSGSFILPATDVAAQQHSSTADLPYFHAHVQQLDRVEHSRCQVKVRGWAVCNACAAGLDGLDLVVAEVDAVRHDRLAG